MPRVAIVEDHERLADLLSQALAAAGIESDRFGNVREATYGVDRADYALLIIDRGLPDGEGLAFLRTLRAAGRMTPCLMLTARDALHDRIDGLESGADDYVTKPFEMSELVARVRTLMRRPALLTTLVASFADVSVDPPQRAMRCGDRTVPLAPAELQVMLCLIEAAGRTVRHSTLEHAAWGLGEAVTP
ncbi:response regulator transcription factor, partial [Burkholderia sp.]